MLVSLPAVPPLAALSAWCSVAIAPIPGLLFVTGLVGGLAHCGPMCGPFVLAQAAGGPAGAPVLRRLADGLLLPYHVGRVVTYSVLGSVAATLGLAFVALGPVRVAVALLLEAAALLFIAQAAARLAPGLAARWGRPLAAGWAASLAAPVRRLLACPGPAGRFALGAVLGLLPCGFLYGALAAAAATRDPLAGAVAMAAFGLGTVPSLFVVGLGGAGLAARWRTAARRVVAPLFLVNAVVLSAMAVAVATTP